MLIMGPNSIAADHIAATPSVSPSALALVIMAKGTEVVRSSVVAPHACRSDVVVSVTVPEVGQFDSVWCLDCLEDTDPLAALELLVPGCMVSARAAAV